MQIRVLPSVPFHRLFESYFLRILTDNGTVFRPGVDLERVPTVLQEPYLNSALGFASVGGPSLVKEGSN